MHWPERLQMYIRIHGKILRFLVEFGSANVLPLSFVVLKTMFVKSSDIVIKAPL
jgi:hypothetical protein